MIEGLCNILVWWTSRDWLPRTHAVPTGRSLSNFECSGSARWVKYHEF